MRYVLMVFTLSSVLSSQIVSASAPMRMPTPCPPKTQVKLSKFIALVRPVRKESHWQKLKLKNGKLNEKLDTGRVVTETVYLVKRVFKGDAKVKYVRIVRSCALGWMPLSRLRYQRGHWRCTYKQTISTRMISHFIPMPGRSKPAKAHKVKTQVSISSLPAGHPLAKGKVVVTEMKGIPFVLFSQVLKKVGEKIVVERFSHRKACPGRSSAFPSPMGSKGWAQKREKMIKQLVQLIKEQKK